MSETLKLDYADAIMIFSAVSNQYLYIVEYTSRDEFFELPIAIQELALQNMDMYKDLYKRLAEYMEANGEVGARKIFDLDTVIKPKKDV